MNFRRTTSVLARTAVAVALGASGMIATAGTAQAQGPACNQVASIGQVKVNNVVIDDPNQDAEDVFLHPDTGQPLVKAGDTVSITFTTNEGCTSLPWTFSSYQARSGLSPKQFLTTQRLFDYSTAKVAGGATQTLTIDVPMASATAADGDECTNKFTDPQASNGNGSTDPNENPYASTCDGRASENGNGGGNATGRPCQGCVGNADNKNPKGQAPNGSDANAGYECDRNNGVGKGNPAHTGCQFDMFQIDLHQGKVLKQVPEGGHPGNQAYYANFP